MADKRRGREKESSGEDRKLELEAAAVEVPGAQQKLKDPLDKKQAVNESTIKAAQNQPESTPVSHNVAELEGSKTGEGQEGTLQPQLSSSEKSGDITVEIEKQQNDELIIADLRSEVERLQAINSRLRFEAAEVSGRLGDAKMNLDRLKKILKDKDVAHALKNQTATKDAEEQTSDMPSEIKEREAESSILDSKFSNINKAIDAEIKYQVAKINKQKQEIDSLSKNNDELLEKYEAENAKNERMEEILKTCKEKMLGDQKILSQENRDKHKVVKLMEKKRSRMIDVAGSIMATLSDKLQALETAFEEHCKLIQRQLSNCSKEIQMVRPLLRSQNMTDENDELTIKYLSAHITSVVLEETNRTMKERLEEDARLLERHLKSQPKLERLKKKVEAREKELEARSEETEVAIKNLTDAVNYYRERYHQLYENYHAREGHST